MNAIFNFPKEQFPVETFTTFQNCMKGKDYLSAYRTIRTANHDSKEEYTLALIETLAYDDRFEEILNISSQIELESERNGFLFNIASEYLKIGELYRVYDLYIKLDKSYRYSLFTKLFAKDPQNSSGTIASIFSIYKANDQIEEAIDFIKAILFEASEPHLFHLGLELINEKRWEDCQLIANALDQKKSEYLFKLNQAKGH